VLEVLLAIRSHSSSAILGFVRYYIDARPLSHELALIDQRIYRQTAVTLGLGALLVALVMTAAFFGVQRAQRVIAERNERLTRANFELTLSAKASALGQITSHLIHGLQVPMAGLRAVVTGREADQSGPDWATVAGYTERLQPSAAATSRPLLTREFCSRSARGFRASSTATAVACSALSPAIWFKMRSPPPPQAAAWRSPSTRIAALLC
jgi:signal transduction histidine kinase